MIAKLVVFFLFVVGQCLASASAAASDIFVREDDGESIVISNVPAGDDFRLLLASPRETGSAASQGKTGAARAIADRNAMGSLVERARQYGPWVDEAARDTNVDARLLHAVIATESAYNPAALSPKGAVGIMQLLPSTARRYSVDDIRDARQNIRGGARYLADLLRLFNNDTRLALAAYNAGENAVIRHGRKVPPFRETEAYVSRVLGIYRRIPASSL